MTETEVPVREATGAALDVPPEAPGSARVTVIKPAPRWPHLDLRELWHFRELALHLAWRDVAVRYKQTAIGVAWAILQPFLTMVVFTIVFGKFGNFPTNGVPYPIFSYSALLPWTYFASSMALASASVVTNKALVTKVYFPRVLLPLEGVAVPVVDFAFAFTVLIGMMAWFSAWPTAAIVLAPGFLAIALVTALGVGLFFSALNVRYRDVPYIIPFLTTVWMYFSGVVFAVEKLASWQQWILSLNPLTAAIAGFQWGVVGTDPPQLGHVLVSVASMAVIFVVGLWYFRGSEPRFADTM
ncbi:MAG TPA: ABC transporter permease [Gaiellaceae bacterium]|nr:ABC transporter permease [Gaiellaceae bacterium]